MKTDSWSIKSFSNLVEIGKGSFSSVYSAIEINSNKQIALKVISMEASKKMNYLHRVKREVDTQYMLNYKRIVKILGCFQTKKDIYVVMELCSGPNLYDIIY